MATQQENRDQVKRPHKVHVRSAYLFPAYDFGTARRITETVEQDGGGSLTEETLAIALGVSVKSSGFRLRTLAARQFGLLTKQGQNLKTTNTAKAIFKPTSEQERTNALKESFLAIPLFRAVATRFKGQPLPQGEAFRNVLEREFRIESARVSAAERVLIDSAREAGLLHQSGNNVYLSIEITPVVQTSLLERGDQPPPSSHVETPSRGALLTISEQDLEQFDDKEFDEIWKVLGKVVRARARATKQPQEEEQKAIEVEKEKSAKGELPF